MRPRRRRRARLAALLALAVLAGPAACRPARPNVAVRAARMRRDDGYPATYPHVERAERAERERAFRAKNPGPWISTALDPYGFFAYVTRPDTSPSAAPAAPGAPWTAPPFTREELAYWRDLIMRNAALFGVADPAIFAGAGDAHGIEVKQLFRGKPIAVIQVGRYGPSRENGQDQPGGTFVAGHHWPRLIEPPGLLDDDQLSAHVVGTTGRVVLECETHPCDPPGRREGFTCPSAPPPVEVSHAIRPDDVKVLRSQRVVFRERGRGPAEVRVLASIELQSQPCPPAPPLCDMHEERCPLELPRSFFPSDVNGVTGGWAVDAATGEVLMGPYFGATD